MIYLHLLSSLALTCFINDFIRESNLDKYRYAIEAYQRHIPIILNENLSVIPNGLTKEMMMKKSFNSEKNLTGKQIWETNWMSLNSYVTNKMLPIWLEVRPVTKDGKVRSGVENFEPALLQLRKRLFDLEKNSIQLITEDSQVQETPVGNIPTLSSATTTSTASHTTTATSSIATITKIPALSIARTVISSISPHNSTAISTIDNTIDNPNPTSTTANTGEEIQAKKGRKPKEVGIRVPFENNWFPVEWLAFIKYGPISSNPYEGWNVLIAQKNSDDTIAMLSSPDDSVVDDKTPDSGRAMQRKKRLDMIRSDPRQNKKPVRDDVDQVEENDQQLSTVLTELSMIRHDMDAFQAEDIKYRKADLRMRLIEKMNLSEEEKKLNTRKFIIV